jgi:hypothetical protein
MPKAAKEHRVVGKSKTTDVQRRKCVYLISLPLQLHTRSKRRLGGLSKSYQAATPAQLIQLILEGASAGRTLLPLIL